MEKAVVGETHKQVKTAAISGTLEHKEERTIKGEKATEKGRGSRTGEREREMERGGKRGTQYRLKFKSFRKFTL